MPDYIEYPLEDGSSALYCRDPVSVGGTDTATWRPDIDVSDAGNYKVYAWWVSGKNGPKDAKYTIYYGDPSTDFVTITVDQTKNGGQWNELATLPFPNPDTEDYRVVLSNDAATGIQVRADAVKFELQ